MDIPAKAAPVEREGFFVAAGDVARQAAIEPTPAHAPASQSMLAVLDVLEGARAWRLWGLLGWQDIRQRYRRSKIGPFWVTISMGAMIGGMGLLYAGLFHTEVSDYLPFLTIGLIVWGLISSLINENCNSFIEAESIIKQVQLPLSIHAYRVVWRNLILFGHNFVIFVVVAVIFGIWPGWSGLLALPGLVFICVNGVWVGIFLGLVSARFRDVPQIVSSVVQIAFFLTPIMWKPESLRSRSLFVDFNPFYYFLELVRAPLLAQGSTLKPWLVALAATLCGWTATFLMYRRYRRRIAYWL